MQKQLFFKFIKTSVILNVGWAFISSFIEYQLSQLNYDSEFIFIGIGFVIVYALTFFPFLQASKRTINNLLALTFTLAGIFITATFLVPLLFVGFGFENREWLFLFFSSLFSSFAIVALIGRYFNVRRKYFTIALTTLIAFSGTLLFFYTPIGGDVFEGPSSKRIIHPLTIGYCCWQLLTTITIGQAIFYRKSNGEYTFMTNNII